MDSTDRHFEQAGLTQISILGKLGLRDRAQAVVAAYETGLVSPGDRDVTA